MASIKYRGSDGVFRSIETYMPVVAGEITAANQLPTDEAGKSVQDKLDEHDSGLADIAPLSAGLTSVGVFEATNLTDDNFTDTNLWAKTFISICTFASNEATLLVSAQNGVITRPIYGNSIVNHKYYVSAWIKANSASIILGCGATVIGTTGSGSYEHVSLIHTATSTTHTVSFKDTRASGWDTFYAKRPFSLDLTGIFGSGYEPTLAQMDAIMRPYTDMYFSGTTNLAHAEALIPYLIEELRILRAAAL